MDEKVFTSSGEQRRGERAQDAEIAATGTRVAGAQQGDNELGGAAIEDEQRVVHVLM